MLQQKTELYSLELLQRQLERESFQDLVKKIWQKEQSKRSWITWLKCSGQTIGATPEMGSMGSETYSSSCN
eukprot:13859005-Ditylum_brightwellii.AAC.1